jgi:hypothetical protein
MRGIFFALLTFLALALLVAFSNLPAFLEQYKSLFLLIPVIIIFISIALALR